MLATEASQVGVFDAAELVRPLAEGSFYALLATHGERIVSDRDFSECYSRASGGPHHAVEAREGAVAPAPHGALRRAGDGGRRVGSALEGRVRAGG